MFRVYGLQVGSDEGVRPKHVPPNSEVNISHETTTLVLWIYDGI